MVGDVLSGSESGEGLQHVPLVAQCSQQLETEQQLQCGAVSCGPERFLRGSRRVLQHHTGHNELEFSSGELTFS